MYIYTYIITLYVHIYIVVVLAALRAVEGVRGDVEAGHDPVRAEVRADLRLDRYIYI